LAGHSEGGLISLLAARQVSVAGIVLLATPGRKLADVIRDQLQRSGMEPALLNDALAILTTLERGETVAGVDPALQSLFRPSVQGYLISGLTIDPVKVVRELTQPLLIVSGGHDLQVGPVDAALLSTARPDATSLDIPAMNHVLKIAPADSVGQQDAYSNPDIPLAEGLSKAIADFVGQAARRQP